MGMVKLSLINEGSLVNICYLCYCLMHGCPLKDYWGVLVLLGLLCLQNSVVLRMVFLLQSLGKICSGKFIYWWQELTTWLL